MKMLGGCYQMSSPPGLVIVLDRLDNNQKQRQETTATDLLQLPSQQ